MSGSWLAIAQGFAGMKVHGNKLRFSPFCPSDWDGYQFNILYRERLISICVSKEEVAITLQEGNPIEIEIYGSNKMLENVLSEKIK